MDSKETDEFIVGFPPNKFFVFYKWLKKPWDRCKQGNHIILSKTGYSMCRKHGEFTAF